MNVAITIALKTKSADNGREHPMVRHKRVKRERAATADVVVESGITSALEGRVTRMTLTRIAPRTLDVGNLPSSMKAVQDEVCKQLGLDDSVRGGIDWRYAQEKGPRGGEAVRVEIESEGGNGIGASLVSKMSGEGSNPSPPANDNAQQQEAA